MDDLPPIEAGPYDSKCPACGKPGVRVLTIRHEVPYFGEAHQTLVKCPSCGYRHTDFLIATQKEPVRYRFRAAGPDDLRVRVIRSNTCVIEVPELGIRAEPTLLSESFVSNVEGVLVRMEGILLAARREAESAEVRAEADRRLARLARMRAGSEPVTVVLEDPDGNSLIVSEKAERETLTQTEVDAILEGLPIFDVTGGGS